MIVINNFVAGGVGWSGIVCKVCRVVGCFLVLSEIVKCAFWLRIYDTEKVNGLFLCLILSVLCTYCVIATFVLHVSLIDCVKIKTAGILTMRPFACRQLFVCQ